MSDCVVVSLFGSFDDSSSVCGNVCEESIDGTSLLCVLAPRDEVDEAGAVAEEELKMPVIGVEDKLKSLRGVVNDPNGL